MEGQPRNHHRQRNESGELNHGKLLSTVVNGRGPLNHDQRILGFHRSGADSGTSGVKGSQVKMPGVNSTGVDVFGPNGEYIAVGGPGKSLDISTLGTQMKILKYGADQAGVRAIAYFREGTPQVALDLAKKWLGDGDFLLISEVGRNVKRFCAAVPAGLVTGAGAPTGGLAGGDRNGARVSRHPGGSPR
jgi:hypothetical protein